jgi:catechol 2,3-dioxygenase-like lactoylglutathione lyase family enzyme
LVYVKDVQLAPGFYRDLLGFKLVDEYRHEGKPCVLRGCAPLAATSSHCTWQDGEPRWPARLYTGTLRSGNSTIFAAQVAGEALLHYANAAHDEAGWRHAYLNDLNGDEISLYWAGENRMKKDRHAKGERSREDPGRQGILTHS